MKIEQVVRPSRHIVTGRLDKVSYSSRRFELEIAPDEKLIGRLAPSFEDLKALRSLSGEQVTLVGMVHYEANGTPRFIEVDQILPRQEGDEGFCRSPTPWYWQGIGPPTRRGTKPKPFDFRSLIGSWPGDEPIEDLMAALKELR